MVCFLNDYNSIGHKDIINKLLELSNETNIGYGLDKHTINAKKLIQKEIGNSDADIYFLSGGTITNKIGLAQMLRPYEAIICVDSGHINVHETGAVESNGHKILTVKGIDGKINSSLILSVLKEHEDFHKVLPRCVYISNSTEIGTIYNKKELEEIYKVCKDNNLYLFIDGARLGCALECDENDLSLKDIAKCCDMFYIGGTKNGAPLGEALIILNNDLKKGFSYLLKNQGGLLAKGFVAGIIFEEFFKDNLYYKNAKNSVEMAKKLRNVFKKHNISEAYINPTNQVFVNLDSKQFLKLKDKVLFEKWEENNNYIVSRFVTNFNTTNEDIDELDTILSNI